VSDDINVKVLDFGLAKVYAGDGAGPDLSQSPTVTAGGTRDGMILGTPAYMSPEQARGQAVDKRADIWTFGCVLYEMLTGRAAFAGDTVSDTIAAILDRQVNWSALPETTPSSIRRLLQRCLEKDPKRRLRDSRRPTASTSRMSTSLGSSLCVGLRDSGRLVEPSRTRRSVWSRRLHHVYSCPVPEARQVAFAIFPGKTKLAHVSKSESTGNVPDRVEIAIVEFFFHHGALCPIHQLCPRHAMLKVISESGRQYVSRDHGSSPLTCSWPRSTGYF